VDCGNDNPYNWNYSCIFTKIDYNTFTLPKLSMTAEAPLPNQQANGELNRDRVALPVSNIAERLVYTHRGMLHFQDATTVAATTKGVDVGNALEGVAREMVGVGVAPTSVLERLTALRGTFTELRYNNFIDERIIETHAMMGNLTQLASLMPDSGRYHDPDYPDLIYLSIRTPLYAAEAAVRNGEDPTPIVEDAITRIANSPNPHWGDDYHGRVTSYVMVGKTLHKVGLDPNMAFSKAEAEIIRAKATKDHLDTRACEELAEGYASVGNYEDALRMVDYIDVEGDPHELSGKRDIQNILNSVIRMQKDGDFSKALEIAQKFGWNHLTARILAKKTVSEARQGIKPDETISQIEGVVSKEAIYAWEDVYPQVYLSLVLSGNQEAAQAVFDNITATIEGFDEDEQFNKALVRFALAEAVDEAGGDARQLYRQAFSHTVEFRTDGSGFYDFLGISWDIHRDGVRTLIGKGHLDLAREYLDQYPDDGWMKSMLTSELAVAEVKKGFKPEEVRNLPQTDLQAILSGDDEAAKQAVAYFGLAA